jgi:hypothetical protein
MYLRTMFWDNLCQQENSYVHSYQLFSQENMQGGKQ